MANLAPKLVTVDALDELADVHAEVIDGALVVESMATFEHSQAQIAIGTELFGRFRGRGPDGRGGWWIATEVTVEYASDQGYRHDLAGWRKDRLLERPTGPRVKSRPDWACEILSTNKRHDLIAKRRVLHRHGVPHYWLLDPEARLLTVLRHHPDAYLMIATHEPGERARIEPFDMVELEVARFFGDIDE